MTYLVNKYLRDDGILPVDRWEEVEADGMHDALRIAVKDMNPDILPFTVYVAEKKPAILYPNGTPMVTHGFTIAKS